MNRLLAIVLAPLLLAGALFAQGRQPGMSYKLRFSPDPAAPRWIVDVDVVGLDPEQRDVKFVLNDWGAWSELGDKYLLRRVSNPALGSASPSPSTFQFDLPEVWDGNLHFSYELALLKGSSEEQRAHSLLPHFSDDYSFGYSNNTLARLLIKGEVSDLPCSIKLDAPPSWKVLTGWSGLSDATQLNQFRPEESALIAFGKNIISDHRIVDGENFECHILGGGPDLTGEVLKIQTQLLPALGKAWGEELGKPSVVFFVKHKHGGTRMEHGTVIGLGPDQPERFISSPYTTQLIAHEFVHEWLGGKLLRENASLVWFGEGFTDYLSVYYAAKLDLIPKPWFVERITEIAQEALGNSSLGQVAFDDPEVNWRDGDGPNETMAYKGGALIAFAMDVELRARGHEGLMGLMRALLVRCNGVYFIDDIRDELANFGLSDFYERFIAGKEIPDLSVLLENAGAKRLLPQGDAPARFVYDESSMGPFFK